jgi:hypothetical protein
MRCTACGAELILMKVVPDSVPSFEHHTFICSECHATELRVVFTRYGRGPTPSTCLCVRWRVACLHGLWRRSTLLLPAFSAACWREYAALTELGLVARFEPTAKPGDARGLRSAQSKLRNYETPMPHSAASRNGRG